MLRLNFNSQIGDGKLAGNTCYPNMWEEQELKIIFSLIVNMGSPPLTPKKTSETARLLPKLIDNLSLVPRLWKERTDLCVCCGTSSGDK